MKEQDIHTHTHTETQQKLNHMHGHPTHTHRPEELDRNGRDNDIVTAEYRQLEKSMEEEVQNKAQDCTNNQPEMYYHLFHGRQGQKFYTI